MEFVLFGLFGAASLFGLFEIFGSDDVNDESPAPLPPDGLGTGETAEIIHITGFNPEEDVIRIGAGYATSIVGSQVEEAADGSYSNLIVELRGDGFEDDDESSSIVIRLDRVTGYSAAELLVEAYSPHQ